MALPTVVLGLVWTQFAIAALIIVLRSYSCWKVKTCHWDYIFALISTTLGLGSNILCTISVGYGAGKHQKELSTQQIVDTTKYQWFLFYIYVWAITASRLSMIAALYRMVALIRPKEIFLGIVAMIVVVVNLSTSVLQWVQCTPVSKTWDDRVEGVCDGRVRNNIGGFIQGSTSAAVDLFLVVFPCFIIQGLNMSKNRKIALCFLFSFGIITIGCAIIKTIGIALLTASNATYELAKLDIYSLTELWVSLMVGAIPSIVQYIRIFKHETSVSNTILSKTATNNPRQPQKSVSQENILLKPLSQE